MGGLWCPGKFLLSNFARIFRGTQQTLWRYLKRFDFFYVFGVLWRHVKVGCPVYRGPINPMKYECRKVCPCKSGGSVWTGEERGLVPFSIKKVDEMLVE